MPLQLSGRYGVPSVRQKYNRKLLRRQVFRAGQQVLAPMSLARKIGSDSDRTGPLRGAVA